jgi:signal-transduction protein with cAMP-binding, CBS, and nucleotidyltransferase domain
LIVNIKLVKHILKTKGGDVWSTTMGETVFDAIKTMSDKGVGALLVIESGKLVGIISERDYTRKVILKGKSSKETAVREIMTAPVIYTTPEETAERCMALMTARRIRHLPVLDDGKVVGVISIGDLVKSIIAEQENWIRQLENHVLTTTSIV